MSTVANHQLRIIDIDDDGYRQTPAMIWPADVDSQADTGTGDTLVQEWLDSATTDGMWVVVSTDATPGGLSVVLTDADGNRREIVVEEIVLDEDGREL